MPNQSDRVLFLLGLMVFTVGQIVINALRDALHTQSPIDYAHWLLIIAVMLMVPFAVNLRRRAFWQITGVLLFSGIICVIGMCVLDFVFWALGPSEQATALFVQIRDNPAIWQVFMVIGPNWLFNTGLALPALAYWQHSKTGLLLVIVGSLVIMVGTRWFNVAGYVLITLGYLLQFRAVRSAPPASVNR